MQIELVAQPYALARQELLAVPRQSVLNWLPPFEPTVMALHPKCSCSIGVTPAGDQNYGRTRAASSQRHGRGAE
jgi:hypothetical protein